MSSDAPLVHLNNLSLDELRATWRKVQRCDPPELRTRDLMALALAYRIQADQHGDLTGATKRRMAELARRFRADRSYVPIAGQALKPGSSLIKEYRGVRHEVRVREQGFSYLGEPYGSLSEVARRITGTKWNGQVFFGLKERRR